MACPAEALPVRQVAAGMSCEQQDFPARSQPAFGSRYEPCPQFGCEFSIHTYIRVHVTRETNALAAILAAGKERG